MKVLDIISTDAGYYGVIVACHPGDPLEYTVRFVTKTTEVGHTVHGPNSVTVYKDGGLGLFNEKSITKMGFCENDHEQALILCAAAGVAFSSGNGRTDGQE